MRPSWVDGWKDHWLLTIALVKPGVTLQTAAADMSRVMANIGNQHPDSDKGRTVQLVPITTALRGANELPEIWVMLGAVLAVLLTACVNVAGLPDGARSRTRTGDGFAYCNRRGQVQNRPTAFG